MVRLRLVFEHRRLLEKSQRSQGLRRCWFLLKPEIASIGDLVSQICECFGLRHRIVLSMDDFVLPSFESTRIIMDKDIIRIHDLDHPGGFGSRKRKRRPSKKLLDSNGQHVEINHENEFGPSNNSDVRKKSLLYDEGRSIKQQDRKKENSFPQTTDNDQCFKVDGAIISDGILPLPKPQKHVIHFEILPPLRRLPVKGDILAYRFDEPSSSVCPQLSSPQVGIVSSFDYTTLQIILLPVLDYVFLLDENLHRTIVQKNAFRYKEDGSLEIEYLSLIDVRLVKDNGPQEKEKACQDDQARKDNWEEALVKGSWNEPNASTAEQSNGWAPWIPNKSTTAMCGSFKQYNTPLAGRGNGRTSRAPNRWMNTRVPSKNTTNWNRNTNNATWNPNRA